MRVAGREGGILLRQSKESIEFIFGEPVIEVNN